MAEETQYPVGALQIEHSEADGTLLCGTVRGDGAGDVVKPLGWRWGRSIGAWFIPRSRDRVPRRDLIERTAELLRAAGFAVEVAIDATPQDRSEREARYAMRAQQRSDRLRQRAETEQARAEHRFRAEVTIAEGIPLGQPMLVDHYSYGRDLRTRQQMRRHLEKGLEHHARAAQAAEAASLAEAAHQARTAPVTVANRIERLAAQIRKTERDLAELREGSARRVALEDQLAADRADLDYWQHVRAQQLADGTATGYDRETVNVGDAVKIRGQWYRVARVNIKTVTVETGYGWNDRTPWHEVQDHRASAPTDAGMGSPEGSAGP